MGLVPLWVCATLLLTATLVPQSCFLAAADLADDSPLQQQPGWDAKAAGERSPTGTTGGCPAMKLRPSGQCGGPGSRAEEGEDCPYQLTLPPLTIQLPKQFRLLEKTMKELQSLKETVQKLRSSCMECSRGGGGQGLGGQQLQADQGLLQRGSEEVAGQVTSIGLDQGLEHQAAPHGEQRGDGMITGQNEAGPASQGMGKIPPPLSMQEMQMKLNRMSASLKNARGQITTLQGRVEGLSLVNMDNLRAMVDHKVENITGVVNKLSSSCNSQCAAQTSPQFILAPKDCSDYNMLQQQRKNGVYRVTPDPRNGTFEVFCDMESYGGGWTLIQQRLNGSVSFNRTWADYKKGFGDPRGEFWLGNDRLHLLTKAKDTILRIELEDFEGVREYAKYDQFYVANEFLRYRLSISGYSGTAGNAISFNRHFNHDQKFFTTPDRDNDMYPSGNCGTYYSSGWWFDACMSANLNGKYYHKRYKGVRNGIFWGTWHNMSAEAYPTNYRQAFKTVKMMIRPKNYAP
ncbi:fibrinogen-like 2a [Aplochiton taeniatus]